MVVSELNFVETLSSAKRATVVMIFQTSVPSLPPIIACKSWAYTGSDLVVSNTIAKWIKFEPNEKNFSQGFSQKLFCILFNSLPSSGDFCHLLITFANSLDPDQAQQNVRPDLDLNCLTP